MTMTTRRHSTSRSKTTTTLGDLIAAAYDVAQGAGRERAERAARLLASSLARRCNRRIRFVR